MSIRAGAFIGNVPMSLSSLWQEFKSFAFKGNMIDLAIAVIIGGAFGKVISSLVDHILMPLIAAILPNTGGYEDLSFTINGSEIMYGQFLGALFNFLIVALAIFITVVKTLGALQRLAQK